MTSTAFHLFISIILPLVSTTLCAPSPLPTLQSLRTNKTLQPHVIYEYPKGTWLENLVIRQADGNALVTVLSSPEVVLISTTNSTPPIRVTSIPGVAGCLGIVELSHNLFYVVAGNWTDTTFASTPGSYSIWELDLRHGRPEDAVQRKVADLPDAGFLNGLTVANPVTGTLLVADCLTSAVWSVNAYTGAVEVAINDTTMAPISKSDGGVPLGINAVSVRDNFLYYDNSDRVTFNRIPIDLQTGHATGPAQTLLQSTTATVTPDDFTFDFEGNAWLASDVLGALDLLPGAGSATTPDSVGVEIVAESPPSAGTAGWGWTAAKFGISAEDVRRGSLYVTTNGGPFNYPYGNWTNGGMLLRIDTAELGVGGLLAEFG